MIETILEILFSNLPLLIGVGTFVRRPTPPVSGLSSGKICFSNITTNAGIIQDSFGITVSTYFPWEIRLGEIAFGTSLDPPAVTSSNTFVFRQEADFDTNNRSPRLISVGQINGIATDTNIELGGSNNWASNCNVNGGFFSHSFILNGICNCTDSGIKTSVIVGSRKSYIKGGGEGHVIINGITCDNPSLKTQEICTVISTSGDCGNVIIGHGCICKEGLNAIISSFGVKTGAVGTGGYNSIISSINKITKYTDQSKSQVLTLDYDPYFTIYRSKFSSIISSMTSKINDQSSKYFSYYTRNNLISSSVGSYMRGYSVKSGENFKQLNFNSILSSCKSLIVSGSSKDSYTTTDHGTCFSSIISSQRATIFDSNYSSLIGTEASSICGMETYSGNGNFNRNIRSSTIIGGYRNCIHTCRDWIAGQSSFTTFPSVIISGSDNILCHRLPQSKAQGQKEFKSNYGGSVIISSSFSTLSSSDSVILSSSKARMEYGLQSSIISSWDVCNSPKRSSVISSMMICDTGNTQSSSSSVIISSRNICNGIASGAIWGKYSTHISSSFTKISCGEFNSIISSECSQICNSTFSAIGSSCCTNICDEKYSSIFSSVCSCILGTSSIASAVRLNTIVSSYCSQICNSRSSSIIASCCSRLVCGINSGIFAGYKNILGTTSVVTCNSVILGGQNLNLTFSNFAMVQDLNFSCGSIYGDSGGQKGLVCLWPNDGTSVIEILKGFLVEGGK